MRDRHVLGRRLAGITLFLLAVIASVLAGEPPPDQLPEIALGWQPLPHIERAAAAVGIAGFAFLVIWRAGRGEFPIRFGHVEYEARSVASEMDQGIRVLELRTVQVEGEMEMLEARVAAIEQTV